MFVAPWPLLAVVRDRSAARRLALGCLAGLVWAECTVLPWLEPAARSHLTASPLAATGLAAGAAWLYGGMYLAALALVYPWLPRPRWLTGSATWVLGETLRAEAFGGAAWGAFGHSLHACLPLAQLAELTGVAGLSVLVLWPAAALAESGAERRRGLAAWALAVSAAAAFGMYRLAGTAETPADGSLSIVVVGGRNADRDPLRAYLDATAVAPPASLTIWPEAAVPGYVQEDPSATAVVRGVARSRGWLLAGALRYEGTGRDRRYFNSALLVDPDGRLRDTYDKGRLVPFAERSPWPFPSLVERPFSPAAAPPHPLVAGALRLGVVVCWESIFAEPARGYARDGVDVLVNLTSDRDLGIGAAQQLAFSRFRAIETRRWLVRASGLGPALLIDPHGRVHERATLAVTPGIARPATFYVRHGEIVPRLAVAVLGLAYLVRTVRRTVMRTRGRGAPPA